MAIAHSNPITTRVTKFGTAEKKALVNNNFDLLRLVFASMVCLVHAYVLSGFPELEWISAILSSALAVKAFFVVSGYLIFLSCEQSASISAYFLKRMKRILPAYTTVVVFFSLFLGLVTVLPPERYYFSIDWVQYLLANLGFLNFLHPNLPGVFVGHRTEAINGALWTLKVEVLFYASVPIFVYFFKRLGHFPVIAATYLGSVAYSIVLNDYAARHDSTIAAELARQLPGQLSFFMAGAYFFYYQAFLDANRSAIVAVAVAVLAANSFHALPVLEPIALAAVVLYCALFFYVGNVGKYGDFSYGIYVLHFPIIQLMLCNDWPKGNPYGFLFASVAWTLVGAVAMWHCVEKRFLLRNSHYVMATDSKVHGS